MKKLRLGLLLDDAVVPAWAFEMLKAVQKTEAGSFIFVFKKAGQPGTPGSVSGQGASLHHWLYNAFSRLENRIFKPGPDAFAPKTVESLNLGPAIREIKIEETATGDFLYPQDLQEIMGFEPDVMIYLGKNILRGEILKIPVYGVWSYYHGDNLVNQGNPAGFREVMENRRDTGAVLQVISEDEYQGKILQRSWSSTDRISVNRNRSKYYWNSASFLPRKLDELYRSGGRSFLERVELENSEPLFYSNRKYNKPGNLEMIALMARHGFKWLQSKLVKTFFYNQWILLYSLRSDAGWETSLYRYKRITPPKDRFWADPFIIRKDNRYYIFMEEGLYRENQGRAHISVMEMDEAGNCSQPRVILKKPYHLSYPNVFEQDGTYYMIPESMGNNTIEIYKAKSFPYEWEFVMNLMENISAVDTTLLYKEGLYWLFVNIRQFEGASECDELHLFYAGVFLTQNWTPHTRNPVISDVKSARPAGNFFTWQDRLYRPSQDCSYRYGHSTVINEVIELNKDTYREKQVSTIGPGWDKNIIATHTLNHVAGLTIIDAILKKRKL